LLRPVMQSLLSLFGILYANKLMARTNHHVIIVANSIGTRWLHQLRARARY